MVRTLVFENKANESLKEILNERISNTGLLIGAIDKTKDFILYVIPTPPDDSESQQSNSSKIDDKFIVNHALQVHDMLIGGLDLLGLYCVDTPEASARQLISKIYKALNDLPYYKQMNFNTERILWLINSESKNILVKTIDVCDQKSALQKCDMVIKKDLLKNEFLILNSNYSVDSTFKMPNVNKHELLKCHFYSALSNEFMFDKKRFLCLINDQLFDDEQKFSDLITILDDNNNESDDNSNTLNESSADEINKKYFATLLENLSESSKTVEDKTDKNLESIYNVTGVCSSLIFFNKTTTIKAIKQLFIYDILKSLSARLRLLTEDLDARTEIIGDAQLEDPNSKSLEESYQTPTRIFIKLNDDDDNNSNLYICDYVFPDETDIDISERVKELINYEIKQPSTQIIYVETFPLEIQMSQIEDGSTPVNSGNDKISERKSANSSSISNILLLSIIIAIVAILIGYLWLSK